MFADAKKLLEIRGMSVVPLLQYRKAWTRRITAFIEENMPPVMKLDYHGHSSACR